MPYEQNNIIKRTATARSTTSAMPREIAEDLENYISRLSPMRTPILTLADAGVLKKGSKPKNDKFMQKEYHPFNALDKVTGVKMGIEVSANYTRCARLDIAQMYRPETNSTMLYQPQDRLYIYETGDVVEVIMTENAAVALDDNGSTKTVPDTLAGTGVTGNQVGTCLPGTIVVQNVQKYPLKKFTTSMTMYLGHTITESQPWHAQGWQRDWFYTCNFVERHEKTLSMTDDMYDWIENRSAMSDWAFQKKEMLEEFKMEIESSLFLSKRYQSNDAIRKKTGTNGFLNTIKTNIAYYNPYQVDLDFELMLQSFLIKQAFRYGDKKKICIAGQDALVKFNNAFKDFRRTSGISPQAVGSTAGLDINNYSIPGGINIGIMASDLLNKETDMTHWMMVIDPTQQELRLARDYTVKDLTIATDRDKKIGVEWQGGIAFHLEQNHALLRTLNTNGLIS